MGGSQQGEGDVCLLMDREQSKAKFLWPTQSLSDSGS